MAGRRNKMEREIKFRGRRLDTGEWVYGYYVSGNYEPRLRNYTHAWIMHFGRLQGGLKKIEVDPKTIGEYTGLHDKNGVEVFEGDVVKHHTGAVGRVTFGKYITDNETNEDILGWIVLLPLRAAALDPQATWEIIGNIHQHKHLLENKDA